MKVTAELLEELAGIAGITLSPDETPALMTGLEEMLARALPLEHLDMNKTAPATQATPLKNIVRVDSAGASLPRSLLLSCAPSSDGETILVPITVEQGGSHEPA